MDPVEKRIGAMGPWHGRIITILGLSGLVLNFQKLGTSYIFHPTEFWCSPKELNLTLGERLIKVDDLVGTVDNCGNLTSQCDRWDYDREEFPETVVSQFNLVCGNEFWIALSQSIYMMGYLVGSVLSGVLSDRFGRKRIILFASAGYFLFGVAVIFSPSMFVFNIFRFCTAVCAISMYYVSFTYCTEIVRGKWNSFVGPLFTCTTALGLMCVPVFSWIFPRWTSLQISLTLPVLVVFAAPLAIGFFPKSPHWLISQGLIQEAETVMEQIAEANGEKIEDKPSIVSPSCTKDKASICDLFKTPGLCRSTLVLYSICFCCISIYNCFIMNVKSLIPGNLFLNVEIMGCLEILSSFAMLPLLKYVPRRVVISICMICTGASFLLCLSTKDELLKQIVGQVGQFSNIITFTTIMVFTAEIYPTALRNMGLGTSNAFGRIGSTLAPLLVSPDEDQGNIYIVFGVLTVCGGFLVWLLPETLNKSLKNTIEEGEMFNKEFGGICFTDKEDNKDEDNIVKDQTNPT